MKIPLLNPDAPILRKHLVQACAWARGKKHPHLRHAGYDQDMFSGQHPSCGTVYCIHGAAHLLARGIETGDGPSEHDYADCSPLVRALMALDSRSADPDIIEAACDAPNTPLGAAKWLATYCANSKGRLVRLLSNCYWRVDGDEVRLIRVDGVSKLLPGLGERPEWLRQRTSK